MDVDTFFHHLHFAPEKIRPSDWQVDWENAPTPYKIYENAPTFPLDFAEDDQLSHFLWYVYGLSQISLGETYSYRRHVAAGGGLYPVQLYLYVKETDIPTGVYYYHSAHHQLVLLREGNFDTYISKTLGGSANIADSFAVVFVSIVFWKNFFKYNNFSYRLGGLDVGGVIGQLLETAKRFSFAPKVHFQFLDKPVHHLLGLSEEMESVYGIIPLAKEEIISAEELCEELPPISDEENSSIPSYPLVLQANKAAQLTTMGNEKLPLADFLAICKNRFSPSMDFILAKISKQQLTRLVEDTLADFSDDIDIFACLYYVEEMENGAYYYNKMTENFELIQSGDFRTTLQEGQVSGNVNLFQVPICLYLVGAKEYGKNKFGYRGYRIQQMKAGILMQKLLLKAVEIGVGAHALLDFEPRTSDEIFQLVQQGKTSLIQIAVGHYRQVSRLSGSLRT